MGNDSSKAVKGDGDGQEKSQPNAKVTAHRVPCPRLISVCDSIATRVCADVCTVQRLEAKNNQSKYKSLYQRAKEQEQEAAGQSTEKKICDLCLIFLCQRFTHCRCPPLSQGLSVGQSKRSSPT